MEEIKISDKQIIEEDEDHKRRKEKHQKEKEDRHEKLQDSVGWVVLIVLILLMALAVGLIGSWISKKVSPEKVEEVATAEAIATQTEVIEIQESVVETEEITEKRLQKNIQR